MNEEWTLEYYVDESGSIPVRDFLRGLDKKTYARFLWSFEQVRIRNVQAREPLVRHLEGKIWEIREESNTNIYRVLYFFFRGKRITLQPHLFGESLTEDSFGEGKLFSL